MWWLFLFACSSSEVSPPEFAPPADPGEFGGPVGVKTLTVGDLTVEAWYPADPMHEGEPGEEVDLFGQILSQEVLDRVGNPDIATLASPAVRDAEPHPDGPFPAILFSHGFSASRQQSLSLTTHLASRGFVVLATDHRGRTLGDLVPCLFSPPMDGCNLGFDDPAPAELAAIADYVVSGPEDLPVRTEGLGLFGHSAGGNSTTTLANTDTRFVAIAPMTGGNTVTRDDLAVQRWSGTCDAVVQAEGLEQAHEASVTGDYFALQNAGHLAFSDLCDIDLLGLVELLEARDDVNQTLLGTARSLAIDGCPGIPPASGLPECGTDFADLGVTTPIIQRELAAFFERELSDRGDGASTESTDDLRIELGP